MSVRCFQHSHMSASMQVRVRRVRFGLLMQASLGLVSALSVHVGMRKYCRLSCPLMRWWADSNEWGA